MTLATDILKRYGIEPQPAPAAPEPKEKRKTPRRALHLARAPGVTQHRKEWWAHVCIERKSVHLGTFRTVHRASMAMRLWHYWRAQGFLPDEIPRHQTTTAFQ